MKETVTEVETVEKEREVIVCDYCRLVTSDDVDETFGKILLDPTVISGMGHFTQDSVILEHVVQDIVDATTRTDAQNVLNQLAHLEVAVTADLCPNCVDALFGDDPDSLVRTKAD